MKIARVLVAEGAMPNFCALPPISRIGRHKITEGGASEEAKAGLEVVKGADLLQVIKEVNDRATVGRKERWKARGFGPTFWR